MKTTCIVSTAAAIAMAAVGACATGRRTRDARALREHRAPGRLLALSHGRRIHLTITGHSGPGVPTLVVIPCLGAAGLDWSHIAEALAGEMQVALYDRPGLGWSDPGPWPQHVGTYTDDLAEALDLAGITGPLVLAAGSSGGLPARLLAARRPEQVIGLVLSDCSHEDQQGRIAAVDPSYRPGWNRIRYVAQLAWQWTGADRLRPVEPPSPDLLRAEPAASAYAATQSTYWAERASVQEHASWDRGCRLVRAEVSDLGDIPIVVLIGAALDRQQERPVWDRMQREQAAGSTRGEVRRVDAGHHVHRDNPDAVLSAIRDVVERARPAE